MLQEHIDGLTQDCSNSSALAMESLQSRAKTIDTCLDNLSLVQDKQHQASEF